MSEHQFDAFTRKAASALDSRGSLRALATAAVALGFILGETPRSVLVKGKKGKGKGPGKGNGKPKPKPKPKPPGAADVQRRGLWRRAEVGRKAMSDQPLRVHLPPVRRRRSARVLHPQGRQARRDSDESRRLLPQRREML